jgi:RNA polymerase sigma-70 factor (ECF subfamily)
MFPIFFHKKQRGHEFNLGLAETERCQKGSKKPMKFYAFDALYLQRLRSGDPWTEQHFSEYFSALIELKLRRRLRSPSAIEDVRQETFVRTWAAVRSERGIHQPERLGSFVNSVCNNVLLEHYRKSSKENPLCDDSIIDIADPATSVPDAISNREIREKVRDILKSLSEKDHFLLEAVFLNESDKDEICQHVGVNREYLRVLLYRCKKSFRKVFVKEMERLGTSKLTGAKGIRIPKHPVSTRHLEWAGDEHRCSEVRQVGVVRRRTRSARHAEGQIGHERCMSETHTD